MGLAAAVALGSPPELVVVDVLVAIGLARPVLAVLLLLPSLLGQLCSNSSPGLVAAGSGGRAFACSVPGVG